MIIKLGRKSEEYQTPFMITKAELEKLLPGISQNLVGGEVDVPPDEVIKRVFEVVGTANQRKIADAVIEKYKNHVKFLPKIPKILYDYGPDEAN